MQHVRARRAAARRNAVLAALRDLGGFVSAQQLHVTLVDQGCVVGLSTVYRALAEADADGLLETVHGSGGGRAFRYLSVHEHRIRCTVCGDSVSFLSPELEHWIESLGPTYGFHDVRHAVSVTGTCALCATGPADDPP
ncbi:Fur family transcriptional regulator [Streptomyces sp. NPDC015127]|uniref:Fur family transcriptional regulator n=1 Tax=Streptomyces sp. NPDC015127 TaxID=3364939 RepID=UPI0037010943